MTHEYVLERLDDWVGGELPAPERAELDLHLAGCAECRAEAQALRELLAEVGALPAEILPARDLWAEIAPRLTAQGETVPDITPLGRRGWRAPRWTLQAAAALVLVAGSSALTMRMVRERADGKTVIDKSGGISAVHTQKPAESALVAFERSEVDYQAAITELQTALRTQSGRMAPETVEVLETNLRIIDDAIRQSRAALERDPNSAELARMLTQAYDQKLNVLQQAVAL